MDKESIKAGYRGLFYSAILIFIMNFIIRASDPAILWDTALVTSATFTFWVVLTVGIGFYIAIKAIDHYKKV